MLQQFLIIFLINYIGIIITNIFYLPIPGTIIGLILFFILLYLKILKLEKIEDAANILIANMTIFFLPPSVKILDSLHLIKGEFLKILILVIFCTFVTMGVTGKVVQVLIDFTEKKGGKNVK